jgi:uncharacterized membrane protein YbhN (UPF0104 family)
MRRLFTVFVYISLLFLVVALIRADYLEKPEIFSYNYIVIGLVLVTIGFIFDTYAWYKTLIHFGYCKVKVSDAIVSMGLSVFGKYVPGKVWTIIGRSAYISRQYDLPEKETAIVSLSAQFISFWVGLSLGIIGLLIFGSRYFLVELALSVWALFTVLLFSRFFHKLLIKLVRKTFKWEINLPSFAITTTLRILPWYLINWLLWCLGFYFLSMGLCEDPISMFLGLMFALAVTLSLLIIIIPGALGIRESILSTVLIIGGIGDSMAITISMTSRLWFLFGEFSIFLIAIFLKRKSSRHQQPMQ